MSLIDLTNYSDHPEQPNWLVFRYGERATLEEMEAALKEQAIPYECDREEGPPYLLAVRKGHRSKVVRLNYAVLGRDRPRFIENSLLRGIVFGLVLLLVALAVIGGMLQEP